jgi:hypothetical protein
MTKQLKTQLITDLGLNLEKKNICLKFEPVNDNERTRKLNKALNDGR